MKLIDFTQPVLVLKKLPITEGALAVNLIIGRWSLFQKITSDEDYGKEILKLLKIKNVENEIRLVVYNKNGRNSFDLMVSHLKEKLTPKFDLDEVK